MKSFPRSAAVAFFILVVAALLPLLGQTVTPELFQGLNYRYIGPPGNRASAVVGVPGDPLTYYVGASSGGVFKSSDGGTTWEPVFDDQPAQSIGALAVAWSDPNVVWAGTGEAFVRSNISIGNGVYKSTDAGRTWTHMGLEKSGRIGRVAIDPRNPDVVFVAAMGHCYGPQKERGVYRTKDGGKTWEQVLFADENTGCFEIAMDMKNPRILFAGMWPLVIHTWGRESGGPNGGVWKSTDGGDTWKRLVGHGLPEPPIGKVGLAVSYSNPDVVYALMETGSPNRGVLWRSDDGGENWKLASSNRLLNERPHYASRILVNPGDENEVYFAANSISRTLNGGPDADVVEWSGDTHDLWADPKDPDRFMLSDDGGGGLTLNRGKTWRRIELANAQMYHVAVDNQIPYYVYGGMQDGFAHKGPSTGGIFSSWGSSASSAWQSTAGGECGFVVPDPVDPNIVWGGSFNADLQRVDYRTGHIVSAKPWPESLYGSNAAAVKYRFQWTFPIAISPHDHNTVYVGSQFVHRTTDGGRSWELISPDLTTNDPKLQGPSGGLTPDNLAVEYGCVVFAIAESPVEKGLIWAGTNDGLVQVTRDGGKNWVNVTANIPNLPPLGTVSNLEPSRHEAGTCYLTVDFHQVNNRDPYVYKTSDYGRNWTALGADIPRSVFSYCHWIHEDPVRKGMLFLGTENAIYASFDDGRRWLSLQNNLPHAPVHHMVVQSHFNDLVVGTYGRGFWIMDDITPLQQLTDDVLKSEAYLFPPRPAYRLHDVAGGAPGSKRAFINYYLKAAVSDPVKITILDERGDEVVTLSGPGKPGINRVEWNLRYPGARVAKLRTKPAGNPRVVEENRYRLLWEREGWYPVQSWGTDAGFGGFTAAPGTYTVKMSAGGREFTQKLEIRKDPRSAGSVEDIKAQVAMLLAIREDLNAASDMISRLEGMKKQLIDLRAVVSGKDTAVGEAADGLGRKIQAVEDGLLQPTIAEGDTKSFRDPQKIYEKLSVLSGDVADSADFAPNKQQGEVYTLLKERLGSQKGLFDALVKADLAAFNKLLAEKGLNKLGTGL
ncbi:MAG: WD40/YVTN/BNR-like repeat-containing protein [Candidatus Aminicenantales bacterium]